MPKNARADAAYQQVAGRFGRHVGTCDICKGAIKADDGSRLCARGAVLGVEMAKWFRAATSAKWWKGYGKSEHKYVCPDPEVHGWAYLFTAVPVTVVSEQPGLF